MTRNTRADRAKAMSIACVRECYEYGPWPEIDVQAWMTAVLTDIAIYANDRGLNVERALRTARQNARCYDCNGDR